MNVNAVNLSKRADRRFHIVNQFSNRPEFSFCLVNAIVHEHGAYGLWQTLQQVVQKELLKKSDFFIFCEDDHKFTEYYCKEFLHKCIVQAKALDADILSGGYSWFGNAIQVSEDLFWVDKFTGMQFTIIFSKFYKSILDANFGEDVITDVDLSKITDNKFVIYPYISVQKEFGYSDVTKSNEKKGHVSEIFKRSMKQLDILDKVRKYYLK